MKIKSAELKLIGGGSRRQSRPSNISKLLAIVLATTVSACGAIEEQRHKQQAFLQRVDFARISVSTGTPEAGQPYKVLGELSYSEPSSPDAIDEAEIKHRLKKMAYKKWPDSIDAVINENQQVSTDGAQVTVTAEAIQYESSIDRAALHKMLLDDQPPDSRWSPIMPRP